MNQNKIKKKDIKATGHSESSYCLTDFAMSPNNPSVPHIIEKCVDFIEAEGLNATGIHRIPGDQDQVDLLTARFEEDSNVDMSTLGIEVHAVTMVLRKFFATLTEPLVPVSIYEDLVEVSCVQDKSDRIRALKGFLLQMHPLNFKVLKFLIDHLHKVSQKSEEKSRDSKFLSHYWWPILFRVKFDSFEKMVKYSEILEDLLQTLIEHCMSFSFCPWEEQ